MTQFDVTRPRLFLIAKLKIISDNSCCPHSSHSACSKAFLWSSSGGHSRHCLLNWWQLILRHGFGSRANTPACIIDSPGHQRGGWGRKRGHTIREGEIKQPISVHTLSLLDLFCIERGMNQSMYSYDKAVNILSQTVSCTLRALFGHLPQAELGEGGHWTNLGVDALMDVVLLHKVWKTKLKSLAKLDQSNG